MGEQHMVKVVSFTFFFYFSKLTVQCIQSVTVDRDLFNIDAASAHITQALFYLFCPHSVNRNPNDSEQSDKEGSGI